MASMTLPSQKQPVRGVVDLPASKSLTNRALVASAVAGWRWRVWRRAFGALRLLGESRVGRGQVRLRVVRADGHLCGYGGGLWRKKWLLNHERRVLTADA